MQVELIISIVLKMTSRFLFSVSLLFIHISDAVIAL